MKIVEIRKAADVTQQQMAMEMSVAVRTISGWETAGLTLEDLTIQGRQAVKKFAHKHKITLAE